MNWNARLEGRDWRVVRDASGHHRALPGWTRLSRSEMVVSAGNTYTEACRESGDLNEVSDVLQS